MVYIRVYLWCCTFSRFRQMYNVMYMSLWYPTEHIFNALKLSVLHPFIPSYFLFPGHHFSFDCIVLPLPGWHIVGITQYVAFQIGFFHLLACISCSFTLFVVWEFILKKSVNNIPVCERTIVYLSTDLWMVVLIASLLSNYEESHYKRLYISFRLLWENPKEHDSWKVRYDWVWLGERNGNPLQYSCLENSMDGGAWWATVHGIAKSRIRLSDFAL